MPNFGSGKIKSPNHTKELDLKALNLALSVPDVKIFSICESAGLNEYIPLAEIQNDAPMIPEDKAEDAMKDFLALPTPAGGGIFARSFRRLGLQGEYEILKQTIFGRFFIDLWIVLKTMVHIVVRLLKSPFNRKKWERKNK